MQAMFERLATRHLRRAGTTEEIFDEARELLELAEPVLQDALDDRKVYLQIAMDQDIAESRDRPEGGREVGGQHREFGEPVDRRRVVGREAAAR